MFGDGLGAKIKGNGVIFNAIIVKLLYYVPMGMGHQLFRQGRGINLKQIM